MNIQEKGVWIYMNMKLVEQITASQIRKDLPVFASGDTVKVHVRIVEGDKERVQVYQGVVISRRGSGVSETFTVRKISSQIGVERTFSVHSPIIAKIEVVRRGKVRRSKLFYLRNVTGNKATKIKERSKISEVVEQPKVEQPKAE